MKRKKIHKILVAGLLLAGSTEIAMASRGFKSTLEKNGPKEQNSHQDTKTALSAGEKNAIQADQSSIVKAQKTGSKTTDDLSRSNTKQQSIDANFLDLAASTEQINKMKNKPNIQSDLVTVDQQEAEFDYSDAHPDAHPTIADNAWFTEKNPHPTNPTVNLIDTYSNVTNNDSISHNNQNPMRKAPTSPKLEIKKASEQSTPTELQTPSNEFQKPKSQEVLDIITNNTDKAVIDQKLQDLLLNNKDNNQIITDIENLSNNPALVSIILNIKQINSIANNTPSQALTNLESLKNLLKNIYLKNPQNHSQIIIELYDTAIAKIKKDNSNSETRDLTKSQVESKNSTPKNEPVITPNDQAKESIKKSLPPFKNVNDSQSKSSLPEGSVGAAAEKTITPEIIVKLNEKIDADLITKKMSLEQLRTEYAQKGLKTNNPQEQTFYQQKINLINQRLADLHKPQEVSFEVNQSIITKSSSPESSISKTAKPDIKEIDPDTKNILITQSSDISYIKSSDLLETKEGNEKIRQLGSYSKPIQPSPTIGIKKTTLYDPSGQIRLAENFYDSANNRTEILYDPSGSGKELQNTEYDANGKIVNQVIFDKNSESFTYTKYQDLNNPQWIDNISKTIRTYNSDGKKIKFEQFNTDGVAVNMYGIPINNTKKSLSKEAIQNKSESQELKDVNKPIMTSSSTQITPPLSYDIQHHSNPGQVTSSFSYFTDSQGYNIEKQTFRTGRNVQTTRTNPKNREYSKTTSDSAGNSLTTRYTIDNQIIPGSNIRTYADGSSTHEVLNLKTGMYDTVKNEAKPLAESETSQPKSMPDTAAASKSLIEQQAETIIGAPPKTSFSNLIEFIDKTTSEKDLIEIKTFIENIKNKNKNEMINLNSNNLVAIIDKKIESINKIDSLTSNILAAKNPQEATAQAIKAITKESFPFENLEKLITKIKDSGKGNPNTSKIINTIEAAKIPLLKDLSNKAWSNYTTYSLQRHYKKAQPYFNQYASITLTILSKRTAVNANSLRLAITSMFKKTNAPNNDAKITELTKEGVKSSPPATAASNVWAQWASDMATKISAAIMPGVKSSAPDLSQV